MVKFLASVKRYIYHIKLQWLLCGQLLEKFGLLFNLASGYSEHRSKYTHRDSMIKYHDELTPRGDANLGVLDQDKNILIHPTAYLRQLMWNHT